MLGRYFFTHGLFAEIEKMLIKPLTTNTPEGRQRLAELTDRFQDNATSCRQTVTEIIKQVRQRGDTALLEYTRKFDSPGFTLDQLRVSEAEIQTAFQMVDPGLSATLDLAIRRITTFHEHEKEESWTITGDHGIITGRLVNPVDSAGLYVPGGQGGQTPLVSSVLMNGIPAGIAGVARRVMVTPPDHQGKVNPALLVAAAKIGITEIYKVGSAWAIAALAYGTETIKRVDVIVGPGNQFVAEAKQQVSGRVRIDMVAGPSEVLIVADADANPAYIAADMLAQAEHDPQALAMLVTTTPETRHAGGSRIGKTTGVTEPGGHRQEIPGRTGHHSPGRKRRRDGGDRQPVGRRTPGIDGGRALRDGQDTSATPAPSSWATMCRNPPATTWPAPTMSCQPWAPPASPRPWGWKPSSRNRA